MEFVTKRDLLLKNTPKYTPKVYYILYCGALD